MKSASYGMLSWFQNSWGVDYLHFHHEPSLRPLYFYRKLVIRIFVLLFRMMPRLSLFFYLYLLFFLGNRFFCGNLYFSDHIFQ
uniref:Uncharacterized protein n=1 Tax=Arundo donax TaxID=35708 RepID=A0A0A9DMJ1_ARUDO